MARPIGSQNKDKPFREALRMEATLAENGEGSPANKGSLRWIARKLLERAGEETAAAREIGDRLDGKPAQAIIGGDDDDPAVQHVHRIERVIVRPPNPDG
jgi:hypothetical protein